VSVIDKIMKTLHLSIIITCIISIGIILPHASAVVGKLVVIVNDTQYEINYNSKYSRIDTMSTNLHSYTHNFVDMNITSDKKYNDSMTITLAKDDFANIFCMSKLDIDYFVKHYVPFFVSVDGNNENFTSSSPDDSISLKFNVPAGAKNATIGNEFVGMAVSPSMDFKGIPQVGIYRPGQQVIFNGTIVDACGRHLGEEKIYFTAEQLNVTKQVTSDIKGKFSINFTIPENIESGHYQSKIEMYSKTQSGAQTLYLVVEKNRESNIPFLYKTDFGSFVIPYDFDHGDIVDVNFGNALYVDYYATQNGTMEILFPKTLMDLVSKNIGSTTVTSGSLHVARFPERLDSQNHRIFDIPVFAGRNFITIEIPKYGAEAVYNNAGLQVLTIDETSHLVPYNITGGLIQGFDANSYFKRITVDAIGVKGGGHLHLELPRNILDSIQDGKDSRFLITDIPIINGIQGETKPISYTESQTSAETRTLEIDFPQNRSFVEIKGTHIVPEFPFAIPVLLISIMSLIVFYRIKIRK
jgi:hypothetical protein